MRVLSLCDRTGVMVEPWLAAGFDCTTVDINGAVNGQPGAFGAYWHQSRQDVRDFEIPSWWDIGIVFAFPPCTHLAQSGARWFRSKGLGKLIEGLTLVDACRRIAEDSGAPYMIENPVGQLSTYWRRPDHYFDPLDFGGYVTDGEDYTKKTCLWTGGGFKMPAPRPLPKSTLPNPIHHAAPGPDRADFRSVTPRGFAQAVFEANVDMVKARVA